MFSVFVNVGMRQYDLAAAQVAVNCLDEPEACGNRFHAAEQWGRFEKTGKRYLTPGSHHAPGLPALLPFGPHTPLPWAPLLSLFFPSCSELQIWITNYGLDRALPSQEPLDETGGFWDLLQTQVFATDA